MNELLGVKNTSDITGRDYVICQLDNPLGDASGALGAHSFGNDDDYRNYFWNSVGYPGSFQNAMEPDVKMWIPVDSVGDDSDGKKIFTAPFTDKGWSGGPLFGYPVVNGGPRVIGTCSGEFWIPVISDNTVFAGGPHMVGLVTYGATIGRTSRILICDVPIFHRVKCCSANKCRARQAVDLLASENGGYRTARARKPAPRRTRFSRRGLFGAPQEVKENQTR